MNIHKGPKAILIGFTLTFVSAVIILGMVKYYNHPVVQSNQYWFFLFGAFAIFAGLGGPAYVILSTPHIFHWVGLRFGINILAILVFICSLTMTGLTLFLISEIFISKTFHPIATYAMIAATATLWGTFALLVKSISISKDNKDSKLA